MCGSSLVTWLLRPGLWVAVLAVSSILPAAETETDKPLAKGEVVEIFSGIQQGQLDVQLIPRDSRQCRLIIKNNTDKPLSVMLPQAFAGVPVLAQFQPNFPNRNRNQNSAPQAVGIGPGLMGPGLQGPGMMNLRGNRGRNVGGPNAGPNFFPGPLFNIAPEKVGKLKLSSVCLDYGQPNPRPRIKYAIRPIGSYTDKPGVAEVCAMLGRGEIEQRVAQLAAWHLNNDRSWEQLAGIRDRVALGAGPPTYSRKELQAAQGAAEKAVELAKQRRKSGRGQSDSLSQK